MRKFFFFVFVAIIAVSIIKSEEVYRFHVRNYYFIIKGETHASLLEEARKMFARALESGALNDYEDLRDYTERLIAIFPGDQELVQLLGISYIRLGDRRRGAQLVASSMDGTRIYKEILKDVLEILYQEKYYSDLVVLIENNDVEMTREVLFYYGIALYKEGDYVKALRNLKKAVDKGENNYLAYYYLGMAYKIQRDFNSAAQYLRGAYVRNYRDKAIQRELLDLYRRLGRYKDAEKIIRMAQ